jgi:chromosome segregation ATPase
MSSKGTKLTLKKNKKLDCLVHLETGLVFKSATEKVVTGRVVNDELVELDEEAQQLCEEHGFKIDPELVADDTVEAEDTEEVKESSPNKSVSEEPIKKTIKKTEKQTGPVEDVLAPFAAILQRHTKELQDFVSGKQTEAEADKEKTNVLQEQVKDLTEKVVSLTKELDESKKKCAKLQAAVTALSTQ